MFCPFFSLSFISSLRIVSTCYFIPVIPAESFEILQVKTNKNKIKKRNNRNPPAHLVLFIRIDTVLTFELRQNRITSYFKYLYNVQCVQSASVLIRFCFAKLDYYASSETRQKFRLSFLALARKEVSFPCFATKMSMDSTFKTL